jgi:hypothetical protein
MRTQEFLKEELQKLSNQFGVTFNYRFDARSDMHIVSVSPSMLYDDSHYAENEFCVTRVFEKKFFPESILFVADNDILVSVDTPEFIITPENVFRPSMAGEIRWKYDDDSHSHNYALAA